MRANGGKSLIITIDGEKLARYPIKTHLVSDRDDLGELIEKYAGPLLAPDDLLVICERIVAITQGRSFLIENIRPSVWAKFLYRFVSRHPGGIGLRSPHTMELAIREAGLIRLLLSAAAAALTRPLGVRGWFYHLAGADINAIDGPCAYTLPPGNRSAKLGPKAPMTVARRLADRLKINVAIVDANDYGVRCLGYSSKVNKKLIERIFADNPLGQAKEQTPLAIVRRLA